MARVEIDPVLGVLYVVFVALLLAWAVRSYKNGSLTLSAGDRTDSSFDPMAMAAIPPFADDSSFLKCMQGFQRLSIKARADASTGELEVAKANIKDEDATAAMSERESDSLEELREEVVGSLLVYQWRLGFLRILNCAYIWPIFVAASNKFGGTLLVYYTIWNNFILAAFFTLSGFLSLADYYQRADAFSMHSSNSTGNGAANENDSANDKLRKKHHILERPFVYCLSKVFGTATAKRLSNSVSLRRICWLFGSIELALLLVVDSVIWLCLFPLADSKDKRMLLNFWNINMHLLCTVQLYVDYRLAAYSVRRSDALSVASGLLPLLCPCFAVLWISFDVFYHQMGGRYTYFFVDPNQRANVIWYIGTFLMHFVCWAFVHWLDTRHKYPKLSRPLEQFFDVIWKQTAGAKLMEIEMVICDKGHCDESADDKLDTDKVPKSATLHSLKQKLSPNPPDAYKAMNDDFAE